MNLAILETVGGLFKSAFGIVDQFVEDKDKKNELNAKLFELQTTTTNAVIEAEREKARLEAEITKATIQSDLPKWARITYLFGRQAYALLVLLVIALLKALGIELDGNTLLALVGPGSIYAAVKGAGSKL